VISIENRIDNLMDLDPHTYIAEKYEKMKKAIQYINREVAVLEISDLIGFLTCLIT
jgi:hypothetical protein